jgi:Co/Zn/Cd efflux system component
MSNPSNDDGGWRQHLISSQPDRCNRNRRSGHGLCGQRIIMNARRSLLAATVRGRHPHLPALIFHRATAGTLLSAHFRAGNHAGHCRSQAGYQQQGQSTELAKSAHGRNRITSLTPAFYRRRHRQFAFIRQKLQRAKGSTSAADKWVVSVHNRHVSSTVLAGSRDVIRHILWIQAITICWMTVEAIFALGAAWRAHSPALFAFGGDSAIELLSALVVYWRFRSKRSDEQTEQLAARIAGGLLFALAACVTLVSVLALLGHREVRPSLLGIGVLSVAAVVMPLLARQKRRLSSATASAALRADAAESALCGYLSIIALAGLVANAAWGITWADPLAALGLLPLIMKEGWQALKGRPCDCC